MARAICAAGVLKPAARTQDPAVRYVHVSLPGALMPRQAERVRQMLARLLSSDDVILYSPESDLNAIIGFAERHGVFVMPYEPAETDFVPEHRIVVFDAHDIDSSLHQIYDLHQARVSDGTRLICSLR